MQEEDPTTSSALIDPKKHFSIVVIGIAEYEGLDGWWTMNIVLDTVCSRTMVQRDLVPTTKILDDAVMAQCSHRDTVTYPLAVVELMVGGLPLMEESTLPTAVLLVQDMQ